MTAGITQKVQLTTGQTIAKIAAHAGAGGTLSVLQGGKFGHGFVSAGFTEALSPAVGQLGDGRGFGTVLAKTAASAAIGGTASKLSGGSFANGATTGAFQQLFNSTVHDQLADWVKNMKNRQGGFGVSGAGASDQIFGGGLEGETGCSARCVYSAADGTVARLGWESDGNQNQGYGFRFRISADDGSTFVYGHMDPLSVSLTERATVVRGQLLGSYADPTNGSSSGPHLHFEHRNAAGAAIDASTFLNTVMPNHRVTSGFGLRDFRGIHQNHPGHDLVEEN